MVIIPSVAFAHAVSPTAEIVIVRLYRMAAAVRWAPFLVRVSDAACFGASASAVRSVVASLRDAGLVRVVPGARGRCLVVEVLVDLALTQRAFDDASALSVGVEPDKIAPRSWIDARMFDDASALSVGVEPDKIAPRSWLGEIRPPTVLDSTHTDHLILGESENAGARAAPEWATRAARGAVAGALADAVVLGLSAIRGRPVDPRRCSTDAAEVLGLWRALGRPTPAAFGSDLVVVAEWAQASCDPSAARDLRAVGWAGGVDRSRSVATLCRRERWGDRLASARAWDDAGRPSDPDAAKWTTVPASQEELDSF